MEGIKAYKGTIESAEQTLSFLITFIFEGRGNVGEEKPGEEECAQRTQRPCYPLKCTRKKEKEKILIHQPQRFLQRK